MAIIKFFGQQPAAKSLNNSLNKKYIIFVFIKRKNEFIASSEMKCPKSGLFTARC